MDRPSTPSKAELLKFGVDIIKQGGVYSTFKCRACGLEWTVRVTQSGRMPPRYWHCDNGCNVRGTNQ